MALVFDSEKPDGHSHLLSAERRPNMNGGDACRVLGDVVVVLCAIALIFLLEFTKILNPVENGLNCQDIPHLALPFNAQETISDNMLILGSVCIPLALFFVREFYGTYWRTVSTDTEEKCSSECWKWNVQPYMWIFLRYSGSFLYGYAITLISTDVLKLCSGVLRPHFLSVCEPDWDSIHCEDKNVSYVFPILCSSKDWKQIRKARMSFPSGHASLSFYCAVFCVIYIYVRGLGTRTIVLGRSALQTALLLLAAFVSITRITDSYHRWTDVLAGAALGTAVSLWMSLTLVREIRKRKSSALEAQVQNGVSCGGLSNPVSMNTDAVSVISATSAL